MQISFHFSPHWFGAPPGLTDGVVARSALAPSAGGAEANPAVPVSGVVAADGAVARLSRSEAGAALGRMVAVARGLAQLSPLPDTTPTEVDVQPETEQAPEGEEETSATGDAAEQRSGADLSPEERRELQDLRQRDMEVWAHEQAHVAAGGRYVTKAPSYEYETGPDGQRYAVGGEVSIDTSPVPGDPRATMEKAGVIVRAALAPAHPSPQDQRVAAQARSMEAEARGALLREQRKERLAALERGAEGGGVSAGVSGNAGAIGGPDASYPAARTASTGFQDSAQLRQHIEGFFGPPQGGGFSRFA